MKKITLIYFSPTKTTRTILREVAKGYGAQNVSEIDLTKQATFEQTVQGTVFIGAPVYGGRLPEVFLERFEKINIENTKNILTVVYGNREYEDALIELKDLVESKGSAPMGAGAFVAEHSLSTKEKPIAAGRPDENDLMHAYVLGEKTRNANGQSFTVPGNRPYKKRSPKAKVTMITESSLCTYCGKCILHCPVGAIDDPLETDGDLCLRCSVCVRVCASGARSLQDPQSKAIAQRLFDNCQARKEPELFF